MTPKQLKPEIQHKKILEHMFKGGYIGGRHTAYENALKIFPKNERGKAENALKDLVKRNYILIKKTGYGQHIYINPRMVAEIMKIILTEDDDFNL